MDHPAFDRISRLFAAKAARRNALAGAAGAAALTVIADSEAKPAKGRPGASKKKGKKPKQEEKTMFLFLQTSQGGTLSDNGDGTYDLVLQGHHGGTIYFSDRPQRVFGVSPTDTFLENLGFPPNNPPNAALLVNAGDVEDVAIVELFDPAYDEASGRLAYRVKILAAYDENGLDHIAEQIDDSELPATFDQASLFIDDCPDITCCCRRGTSFGYCNPMPPNVGSIGTCWHWSTWSCGECSPGEYDRLRSACAAAYGPDSIPKTC